MDRLLRDFSSNLQGHQGAPCLSLYQGTHRAMAGRQQDALRFRNLVDELEASLRRDYAKREVGPLIKPFRALADDAGFWRGPMRDGLAVLGTAGLFFASGFVLAAAAFVILLLLATIVAFIGTAWRRDRVAAWLFAPYAAWVAFASVLNGSIWTLN